MQQVCWLICVVLFILVATSYSHSVMIWIDKNFDSLLNSFSERRLWTPLKVSKAMPFLLKNDEFSDSIRVIHVLCQVV